MSPQTSDKELIAGEGRPERPIRNRRTNPETSKGADTQ